MSYDYQDESSRGEIAFCEQTDSNLGPRNRYSKNNTDWSFARISLNADVGGRLVPRNYREMLTKLDGMKNMKDDWNGYGSLAPNSQALLNARLVFEGLQQSENVLTPSLLAPSAENGVGISFMSAERRALIECYNTGRILMAEINGEKLNFVPIRADKQGIKRALERLYEFLNP